MEPKVVEDFRAAIERMAEQGFTVCGFYGNEGELMTFSTLPPYQTPALAHVWLEGLEAQAEYHRSKLQIYGS